MIGTLYVISAPSGAGKTSLIHALLKQAPDILMSVSHTTRAKREGEREGVDYYFIDADEFHSLETQHIFLEHACVFGHHYGTSRAWVEAQLSAGLDVLLEIDWQGAEQVRKLMPGCIGIYILPPSKQALRARLADRRQDDQETINLRMSESQKEMSHYNRYDYLLINDEFDSTLDQLKAIVVARRARLKPQSEKNKQLIAELLA